MHPTKLDPKKLSDESFALLQELQYKIIGQDRAIKWLVRAFQSVKAGLNPPHRPITTLLFLGTTGSGKTHAVQSMAEILFGSRNAMFRIDCAEYQHSHEISKLIGAPPGYIGHHDRDSCRLSQALLDKYQKDNLKFNIALFDEIEKAHEALFEILLGVLDNGQATLGDGALVDFSKTILIFTSNLGSRSVEKLVTDSGMGFQTPVKNDENVSEKIYRASKDAAVKFFTPEFINRIDRMIVFHPLSEQNLMSILDLEIENVQHRAIETPTPILFKVTAKAKKFLLSEGTSEAYGARELKRALERFVTQPLSSLIGSKQLILGDGVLIDYEGDNELVFYRAKV